MQLGSLGENFWPPSFLLTILELFVTLNGNSVTFSQLLNEWFPEPAKFTSRLSGFLSALRHELGWDWIAIAERGISGSHLVWSWTASAGEVPPIATVEVGLLSGLVKESLAGAPDPVPVAVQGGTGVGVAWGTSIGRFLTSTGERPRCTTVLVTSHEPTALLLDELLPSLARVLSAYERECLADMVFRAVEQAPDPIELTDIDARLFYANRAWLQYFDYRPDEVLGNTAGSLVRDDISPVHDAAFLQFSMAEVARKRSWLGVLGSRNRGGDRRFNEAMVAPFEAPELGLRGNVAIRRDLEHRALRDAALTQAHKDLRDMLRAVPDAFVVLREHCVYFANDAFFAVCGRPVTEVIGMDIQTFVHTEDWAQFRSSIDGQSVFSTRFQRPDQSVRVVEISGAGLVAFEGVLSRVFVGRDVTENLLSREQYVRDDRLAAIGSLAVGVAHEVNNPLAYVMLNLETLQAELTSRAAQEAISEALDGVRRIRRIVSELRGFWHGGESRAGVSVVDVETTVTAATSLVQNEIRHRATLLRNLEPDLCVVAREGHLVQVLVNILLYAVHSIPENSGGQHTILVGSRSLGESGAEITISDNGRGFAPEELSRMFDPFGVPRVPGDKTGLGLAITKRMVDELGGHIAVTSDGQRGSTFCVVLPSVPRNEASAESRRSHPDLMQAPFRVLVVDDEPLIVRAIKRVLSQCTVQTAADGGEAMALLASEQTYDVILCDLMMPRVSGPELFQHVSEHYSHLLPSFVFMTGGAFSDWSRQFLQTAGCPVITKPFEPNELRTCVEKTAVSARRRRLAAG